MTIASKLNTIAGEVGSYIFEREDPINGILLSLLSRQNCLLLGSPGTSKSYVVSEITNRITGANLFTALLTRFSTPEEIFGPVSIKALQEDRYERKVEGYLPVSSCSFLDECFKANSAILNALLQLMNERIYKVGTEWHKSPLISIVGASNETPQDEGLSAMYDRFMLRYLTKYVSPSAFVNLIDPTLTKSIKQTTITLAELAQAQKEVLTIVVSRDMLEFVGEFKAKMEREKFYASDRRWKSSIQLLQASAYLNGRNSVEQEDLMLYGNVLWNEMEDADKCYSTVMRLINPDLEAIIESRDAIHILLKSFESRPATEQAFVDLKTQLRSHQERLLKLTGAGVKGEMMKAEINTAISNALTSAVKKRW